jgi:tRNA 2-thiouridine synthesizing protein C
MTESAEKKNITFISRAAPYGQDKANLCLDMALASAVFEQNINYVFLEDGVYQLLKGQDATTIQSKTLGNALETLELYGIENIYVDQSSLEKRGFSETDILSGASIISKDSISTLIQQSDSVFNL